MPAYDAIRDRVCRSALVKKKMDRAKEWRKSLWRDGRVQFHIPVPEGL